MQQYPHFAQFFGVLLCFFALVGCQSTPEEAPDDPESKGVAERVRHYRGQVAKSPESPELHYRLGNALLDMGRYTEAYTAYQRALQLKPDYADAYVNIGLTMRRMGNLRAAIGAYEHALDIAPDDKTTLVNLARVAELTEDWERVQRCYSRLYALDGDNMEFAGAYAATLYGLGDYAEAIPVYQKLVAAEAERPANDYRLGFCYFSLGRWPEAIATWEVGRRLSPENPTINLGLVAERGFTTLNDALAHAAAERCASLGIAVDADLQAQLDALPAT